MGEKYAKELNVKRGTQMNTQQAHCGLGKWKEKHWDKNDRGQEKARIASEWPWWDG